MDHYCLYFRKTKPEPWQQFGAVFSEKAARRFIATFNRVK